MSASLKLKAPLLLFLVVTLIVLQLIDPFRGWVILLVGLGSALLIGYLWARSLSKNLEIVREMRFGWAQVGDQLEERFSLINSGRFPGLWVEIRDKSDIPGYDPSRVAAVDINSRNTWRTQGLCTRRGLFTLGPTEMRTSDPFGFFEVSLRDSASTSLLVMPPIVPLPHIDIAPGGRVGEGRPRLNAPERSVSAAAVRKYLPGDSLRHIHWPTSARKDDFYVHLFDSTPSSDWWILLDLFEGVQKSPGETATEEQGVIVAASLADRGLQLGHSVGLIAHGSHPIWMPPQEGHANRWEILRALALIDVGVWPLQLLLKRFQPAIGGDASLIIITPDMRGKWIQALLPLLRRGIVPTVILLDSDHGGRDLGVSRALIELGISQYVITDDLLERPEARPGESGRWEWLVSPSGRAIPVKTPGDLDWRKLA